MGSRIFISNKMNKDEKPKQWKQRQMDFSKTKALEISQISGIPYVLAIKVARGKMTLNDALLRLMRKEKINAVMKKHKIPSGIAAGIVDGNVEPGCAVNKYEAKTEIKTNESKSCLTEAMVDEKDLTIYLFGGKMVTGKVVGVDKYDFDIKLKNGEERRLAEPRLYRS